MSKNKRVRILVFPKWFMHRWPKRPLAFCSVRVTVLGTAGLLIFVEFFLVLIYYLSKGLFPFFLLSAVALSTIGSIFVFFLALYTFKTLVISKDCYNCQFNFHIIAHETTHITRNWFNEMKVEEETLKQTREKLMPLLNSKPELCKYCVFRKGFYRQELEKYLQQQVP